MVRIAPGFSQLPHRPRHRRRLSRRKIPRTARPAPGEMAAQPGLGSPERHLTMNADQPSSTSESPCQSCGACCAYSKNWPRFSTEDDAALDLIPAKFVNDNQSGMRCDGERCSALKG